jgi:hypothetical protein
MRIDREVGGEVIDRLQPLGIEAALGVVEARRAENAEKRRQTELALAQACYEATWARRQYDAVDPDNRLVAAELEQRWNTRLLAVRALEDELQALATTAETTLTEVERNHLLALGADIEPAWYSVGATPATRKADGSSCKPTFPVPGDYEKNIPHSGVLSQPQNGSLSDRNRAPCIPRRDIKGEALG